MTYKLKLSSLLALTLFTGSALADGSPWLPAHGSTTLSANITSGSTEEFFFGEDTIDLGSELNGTFLWLNGIYGYDDIWAFDARIGYADTELTSNSLNDQSELADTTFGVSYQFINEFEADNGWPTITGRLALTIGGDYDPNITNAIGDGASGIDASILVGKSLNSSFALIGDITLRQRDSNVANGVKYLFGTAYTSPIRGLGFQLALAGIRTDSDLDLGEVGFDQFSETNRDTDFLVAGVNYGFGNGISLGFSYTALINGRNVPDTDVGNFSISYSF